jgi:stalled ribosome rescue protein Dom34
MRVTPGMKRKFRGRICQEAKSIRTPVAIISSSTTLEDVLEVFDGVEILFRFC